MTPNLSSTYLRHLRVNFEDRLTLLPRDRQELENLMETFGPSSLRQLVCADIPHVSYHARCALAQRGL